MSARQRRSVRRIVAVALACAVLRPGPVGSADAPMPGDVESAIAFVEAYLALYRDEDSGAKLATKLPAHWDWESVVEGVFGADLPAAGTPGRAAVRDKMERMFGVLYTANEIRAMLKQVEIHQPCGAMIGPDRAVVGFIANSPNGRVANNLYVLRRSGPGWRITDAANGGKAGRLGFIGGMKAGYLLAKNDATPDQFLDASLAEIERRLK
jgi:hypothetical protein